MSINKDLIANPEALGICHDDLPIQELLLELGVIDALPLPPDKVEWTQFAGVDDHPTHWIMVARHSGYPKPSDNGFQMIALPKRVMNEEQAKRRFAVMMAANFHSGEVPVPQWVPSKRRSN